MILSVLTVLYVGVVAVSITRSLWFDELLTYHLAHLPSLGEMFRAAARFDLNPPLFHLLARAGLSLGGGHAIGVRLPSVAEFYFAGVLLFFYARRKIGPMFGALPVLLLWYGPMSQYATEARPYAALCFWFCALLLLWDNALRQTERRWTLTAIALCSLGLLASHVFGTLTLFAFFCAEAVRLLRCRRTDWPLWAALFGPLVFTAFYLPLFASYSRLTEYPPEFQASPRKLGSFYWHNFTGVALCLGAMLVGAVAFRRGHPSTGRVREQLSASEFALFAGQAILPVVLTIIFMLQHGAFWGRYCITSVIALDFLAAYALAVFARFNRYAGEWAFWAGTVLVLAHGFLWSYWQQKTNPLPHNAVVLDNIKPDLPLVTASGLTFVEMSQYEDRAITSRLYYLQDRAAALRIAHATMFNDLADLVHTVDLAGQVVPYAEFVRQHADFLVLATPGYPEDWLLRKLLEDGFAITPISSYRIPYKDRQLFEVQRRASR